MSVHTHSFTLSFIWASAESIMPAGQSRLISNSISNYCIENAWNHTCDTLWKLLLGRFWPLLNMFFANSQGHLFNSVDITWCVCVSIHLHDACLQEWLPCLILSSLGFMANSNAIFHTDYGKGGRIRLHDYFVLFLTYLWSTQYG